MARPSILGNAPPTEAEVNHALECCKAVPSIREELLAMEQEMSDIRERLDKAESQNEHELYEFMLEEKEKKSQQKWEALEKLIRAVLAIPHANAKAAVVGFYLDGKALKEIRDPRGRTLGVNRARHFKKLGLELLALGLRKVPEKS